MPKDQKAEKAQRPKYNFKLGIYPKMKKNLWTEDYRIASYLVNLRGRLGLYSALNFIQDVGWQHAVHLQIELEKNHTWIFTRQKIEMNEWPKWNEVLTIKTWVRSPSRDTTFLQRDYELFIKDRKIGECTSTFGVLDFTTRKLVTLDWSGFQHWRTEGHLHLMPEKIELQENADDVATFQVRNSDIDLNNHVNNTKYAQWILDAIPLDDLKAGPTLLGYEVNFLAETKPGEEVVLQKTKTDVPDKDGVWLQFQGLKKSNGKPTFAARLKIKQN